MSHDRIRIIDFGAGQLVSEALAGRGHANVVISDQEGSASSGTYLILAFGHSAQATSSVGNCDWSADVHAPLDRCFSVISRLGPGIRNGGGLIVAVLPGEALLVRSGAGAQSVLYRSLLGLMEGLRAELLSTQARVSVVFNDPREQLDALARRLASTIGDRSMYSLPARFDVATLRATFAQMSEALAQTPSDARLPPAGPMGEVYQAAING
jgi:hypothetical protein